MSQVKQITPESTNTSRRIQPHVKVPIFPSPTNKRFIKAANGSEVSNVGSDAKTSRIG